MPVVALGNDIPASRPPIEGLGSGLASRHQGQWRFEPLWFADAHP